MTNLAETNLTQTNPTHAASPINSAPVTTSDHFKHADGWVCGLILLAIALGLLGVLYYVKREMDGPKEGRRKVGEAANADADRNDLMADVRRSNLFFLPMFFAAISSVLLYVCYPIIGTALMWAVAWFACGTLMGFIFGIPKLGPDKPLATGNASTGTQTKSEQTQTRARGSLYQANNNLVEVSDWLTKIVVGLGLINLKQAPDYLKRAAGTLKDCFGPGCYLPFGIATILGFSSLGFLFGNVFTRLFLARAMRTADEELEQVRQDLKETDERLRERDEQQQSEITKAREMVKQLAETGAAKAMEDPLLSEQREFKVEKAQIDVAAKFVGEQPEESRTATDFMILAYQSFQKGDYKSASSAAEKALATAPAKEILWKIYNLLGLCYHWQQPKDWKPGGDITWFDEAIKSYNKAIANRNTLAEELLSKANMAFVYLDTQKYQECEAVAAEVTANEKIGGMQVVSICDLARIAAAAAKIMRSDATGAAATLNATKNIFSFEYVFNADDLPFESIQGFAQLPNLKDDIKVFLTRISENLKPRQP